MFRIISTTDNKNMGKILEFFPILGDIILLENDYIFRVDYIKINKDKYTIANANYVLRLVKMQ